jgi:hypothetical protein
VPTVAAGVVQGSVKVVNVKLKRIHFTRSSMPRAAQTSLVRRSQIRTAAGLDAEVA